MGSRQHFAGNRTNWYGGDRFYTSGLSDSAMRVQFSNFNLPQYYEIVQVGDKLDVIPTAAQSPQRDTPGAAREVEVMC